MVCFFFSQAVITRGHTNNLPLLLFFRANIDEVETEVVEIEAKLDKVRHVMSARSVPEAGKESPAPSFGGVLSFLFLWSTL